MIVRSLALSFFVFTATDAWVIRPHRMQVRSVKLAATDDPDYLMPADVFKKPSWEPSTAQPVILQPLQSSLPPTPTETTNAASSSTDEDDMVLIAASTTVSRPPAPTTHPSALRSPENSQATKASFTTRPSVPATPVDDRNILFWRDRMTAQEEERNQKGFRPAFLNEDINNLAFHANVNEQDAQNLADESTEHVSNEQDTVQDIEIPTIGTSAVSSQPDPLFAPVIPLSSVSTKQPVVGDIPVLFWRDRMNEQEEARNQQGFRKPFVENTDSEVKDTVEMDLPASGFGAAEQDEVPSIADDASVESTASLPDADDSGIELNENSQVNGAALEESEEPELTSESVTISDEAEEIAALAADEEDSISDSALMETDSESEVLEDGTELVPKPVAVTAVSEADEGDEIGALNVDGEDSMSEPALMETENEMVASEGEPELVSISDSALMETDSESEVLEDGTELVPEPVAVTAVSDADEGDEIGALNADGEDSMSEPALMEIENLLVASGDEPELVSEPVPITDKVDEMAADVAASSDIDQVDEAASSVVEEKSASEPDLMEANELSAEPVASTPSSETNVQDDIATTILNDSAPEAALLEVDSVTEVNGVLSAEDQPESTSTDSDQIGEFIDLEEKDLLPTLEVNGHVNGESSSETAQIDSASAIDQVDENKASDTCDVISLPVSETQMESIPEDAAAVEAVAPISANSSTKELLQYLFTGSPEGSDELTDETVNQYLADPGSVIAKLHGGEAAVLSGSTEGSVDNAATPANGKSDVATPSTSELLDILFGVSEIESTEDDESTRNGTNEVLNGDSSPKETTKEEEEAEKERITSAKIREMALFTLKELLLQDRRSP